MLKIYPSPFNKFGVFILYGLLSVAAITLAQQDGCGLNTFSATANKLKTIGYVQLYAGHPSIDYASIPWDLYDYINVIAFPNTEVTNQRDGLWNGLTPPDSSSEDGRDMDSKLNDLMLARNSTNPSTKVLLSIRNYDLSKWLGHMNSNPNPNPNPNSNPSLNPNQNPNQNPNPNPNNNNNIDIITGINNIVRNYGLDGVDIEYPGMRGTLCRDTSGKAIWSKADNDVYFVNTFMSSLRQNLPDKTIMLTVGDDPIVNPTLTNYINVLNIETYHYSLYQNLRDKFGFTPGGRNGKYKSYPNNPLNIFDTALSNWNKSGIGNVQKFMGIDFGNTFQIVDNSAIENAPSVDTSVFNIKQPYQFGQSADFVTDRINGLCPNNDDQVILYSFPLKNHSTILDSNSYCNGNSNSRWNRKFDSNSSTPWLYEKDTSNPKNNQNYHYISYEDIISLNRKVDYAMNNSIVGMSISDISYSDDNNNFLKYIRGKLTPPTGSPPGTSSNPSSNPGSSTSVGNDNTSSPVASTNDNQNEGNRKAGKIAGAVIGSILGVAIMGGIAFFGYKNRDKLPFGQNQYSKNMYNQGTTYMNQQPGMIIPNNSPRMVLPDTAAIPVAPSYVTAMFDFIGKEENDLSFKKGDKIEVLERGDGPNDWWVGRVNGAVGEFPGNYVKE